MARKIYSDISPIPPLSISGVKSPKFGLDLRPQSHLKQSGFEIVEQQIEIIKKQQAPTVDLCYPQIWYSLAHFSLGTNDSLTPALPPSLVLQWSEVG